MKSLFITSLLAASGCTLFAQPILTQSNTGPIAGQSYVLNSCSDANSFSPGASGANVTWDFSQACTSSVSGTYKHRAATSSEKSQFPGADLAYSEASQPSAIAYFKSSSSEYSLVGAASSMGNVYHNDSRVYVTYPSQYGTTITDPFNGTANDIPRNGVSTLTVDGYGTLITPVGTYTNAVRVKVIGVYGDTMAFAGSVFPVANYIDTIYSWYVPGIHYPVFSYTILLAYSQGFLLSNSRTLTMADFTNEVIAEKAPAMLEALSVTPETIHIRFPSESFTGEVSICDMTGRILRTQSIQEEAGTILENLTLPAGPCIVRATDGDGNIGSIKVIIP